MIKIIVILTILIGLFRRYRFKGFFKFAYYLFLLYVLSFVINPVHKFVINWIEAQGLPTQIYDSYILYSL